MTLKNAFAAVLKAMRAGKGLTQRNLAEVSSRTYVSKLERAQSSPTLEMITALSGPLRVSPMTLVAITLPADADSGEHCDLLAAQPLRATRPFRQAELFGLKTRTSAREKFPEFPALFHGRSFRHNLYLSSPVIGTGRRIRKVPSALSAAHWH